MKKLFLTIVLFGITGCSSASNQIPEKISIDKPTTPVMEYGVNLKKYPDSKIEFSLDQEFEYDAVEKYGSIAFKAIDVCYSKFENNLNGIDTSSDYGATVLNDYKIDVSKCIKESLQYYPIIPKEQRIQIPRENFGLELKENEIDEYNIVVDYDKSSERYKQMKKECEDDNVLVSEVDFKSVVELCLFKRM